MPEKYYQINVLEWLLDKCQNDEEKMRVQMEYDLFEKKQFIRVLQFLIYFIDTLRANNMVWGVGRGVQCGQFLFVPDRSTQDQSHAVQFRHH